MVFLLGVVSSAGDVALDAAHYFAFGFGIGQAADDTRHYGIRVRCLLSCDGTPLTPPMDMA